MPKKSKKAAPKKRTIKMTPKQRRLAMLLPQVDAGTITLKAALLKAGYAETSANQQSRAVGSVRNNELMQKKLRKVGFNEQMIAEKLMNGVKKLLPGKAQLGYLSTGIELLDLFPAKKIKAEVSSPVPYGDIENDRKAKTPEEARALAEELDDDDEDE
jgi:hypothetical protein